MFVRLKAIVVLEAVVVGCMSSAWSQTPKPITIQPAAGELKHEFGWISQVRELSDGRVLIVDPDEQRLIVADFSNGKVKQIGRKGPGPAEYSTWLVLFALGGDSTIVLDINQSRALLLEGDEIVKTFPSGKTLYGLGGGIMYMYGADRNGSVLAISTLRGNPPDSSYFIRSNVWSSRVDTVGAGRKGGVFHDHEVALLLNDGWIAFVRGGPYRVDWLPPSGGWIRGATLDQPVKSTSREREVFRRYRKTKVEKESDWPEHLPMLVSKVPVAMPDGKLVAAGADRGAA